MKQFVLIVIIKHSVFLIIVEITSDKCFDNFYVDLCFNIASFLLQEAFFFKSV